MKQRALLLTAWLLLPTFGCAAGASSDESAATGSGAASSHDDGQGGGDNGPSSGQFMQDGGGGAGPGPKLGDPKTCAEAEQTRTYIGCDFYPTVTANNVWSVFDYAVVVANTGDEPAEVVVTRGATEVATATVAPEGLSTIYLPWVPELKGPDANACGSATPLPGTVRVNDGAYHLQSSVPVTVYQFNALEYGPSGGPPGKDWSTCPASQCSLECFSYSNDASLLLPSTALTGNFRILGYQGWAIASMGATLSITGLEDGTSVTVKLGPSGAIIPGGGLPAVGANGSTTFSVDRGDVVQLVGGATSDFSGSLVQASKPVQVINGIPCRNMPDSNAACDHFEESIIPAETLGEHYVIAPPTGPSAAAVPHMVRFVGNVDGTTLSYSGTPPAFAPTTINAGQVIDLGQVTQAFEVLGDHEFGVTTFLLAATLINPGGDGGDPSQSIATAVEQYRSKYVFLAPTDYDQNFVDVIMEPGTTLVLDGTPVTASPEAITGTFSSVRIPLDDNGGGAHLLEGDKPFGIQVLGYGSYTSYNYPGGMNLDLIAPPPPPPE